MAPSAIITSRSTLMHVSLAHASSEIQTMDSIIRNASYNTTPSLPLRNTVLPLELMCMIRTRLLRTMTTHLLLQSSSALQEYESSIRSLLCPDCLSYNVDIYGSDIWQWDQFSGPCACACSDDASQNANSTRFSRRKHGDMPQHFVDSKHWLESYLSAEAARLTPPFTSITQSPLSRNNIWDVVDEVLREYGCEVLRDGATLGIRTLCRPRQLSTDSIQHDDEIIIVPLPSEIRRLGQENIGGAGASGDTFRAQVILHLVNSGFGLSDEYANASVDDKSRRVLFTGGKRSQNFSTSWFIRAFQIVVAIMTACFSLPLTFATVALTILCYYSRPRSFRVL